MSVAALEPRIVGKKKSAKPSNYRAIKVDEAVYMDLKLISVYQGREIAQIATELLKDPVLKLRKAEQAKRDKLA